MGLRGGVTGISAALGARRIALRRLGGIALVLMGVHGAMDRLDEHLFALLDAVDLVIDSGFFALGSWLEEVGILTSGRGAAFGERAGEWIGLDEKETLTLSLALGLEILGDLLLIPLAWGHRPPPPGPFNLRGLMIPQVLGFFSCILLPIAGALGVARGLELGMAQALGGVVPGLPGLLRVSAGAGLLVAALCLIRFGPDLLRGAIAHLRQGGFVDDGRRPWLSLFGRLLLLIPLMAGALLVLPGWAALGERILGGLF